MGDFEIFSDFWDFLGDFGTFGIMGLFFRDLRTFFGIFVRVYKDFLSCESLACAHMFEEECSMLMYSEQQLTDCTNPAGRDGCAGGWH